MFCAALIAVVFAIAAHGKVRSADDFATFRLGLVRFGVPSRWATRTLACALVAAEMAVVGLVFVEPTAGFALATGLLLAFSVGIAIALLRGDLAPCQCFGRSAAPLGRWHLVRNAVLVLAAMVGAITPVPGDLPSLVMLALVGAATGLAITRWDDLLYIVRGSPS